MMEEMKELIQFVNCVEQFAKNNQPTDLSMAISALAKLERQVREGFQHMDDSRKAEVLSNIKALDSHLKKDGAKGLVPFLIAYLLVILLDSLKIIDYSKEKHTITLKDPNRNYWYQRVDGKGDHQFFKDSEYLVNSIPKANDKTYYNSEIYNSPYTTSLPKNVIINTFPVDSLQDLSKFIYDLFLNTPFLASDKVVFSTKMKVSNLKGGSRGWGFWNTSVLNMNIAWFIQLDGKVNGRDYVNNGFWAQTVNGSKYDMVRLPDLDEGWHEYRIKMQENSIEYFIDNKSVHKLTDSRIIPSLPMAFHNWVDNAVFTESIPPRHVFQQTNGSRANHAKYMEIQIGDGL